MKIQDLVHEQNTKLNNIDKTLIKEEETLAQLLNLEMMINQYIKAKSDKKLYVWLIDNNFELSSMQMNCIDEIVI